MNPMARKKPGVLDVLPTTPIAMSWCSPSMPRSRGRMASAAPSSSRRSSTPTCPSCSTAASSPTPSPRSWKESGNPAPHLAPSQRRRHGIDGHAASNFPSRASILSSSLSPRKKAAAATAVAAVKKLLAQRGEGFLNSRNPGSASRRVYHARSIWRPPPRGDSQLPPPSRQE